MESLGSKGKRWSLNGMNALVTGGSKGIGYAIVEELAGFGARVHTCARDEKQLNQSQLEWKAKGFEVSVTVCDLSSKTQREELFKTVATVFDGKLQILVNNAAKVAVKAKAALEHNEQEFLQFIGTNLESPYHLSLLAHPLLKSSGGGSIVFISSVVGGIGINGYSLYSASKAAINQLARSLTSEWSKDNIRINTVAPGGVNTQNVMLQVEIDEETRTRRERYMESTPLRRSGEPEEISSVTAFLCLPAASYITGQLIYVDGGFSTCG